MQLERCVVRLYIANKRLDLEVIIFPLVCMLTRDVRLPIIIQIVHVFNLHFQSQRFEWNTFQARNAPELSGLLLLLLLLLLLSFIRTHRYTNR